MWNINCQAIGNGLTEFVTVSACLFTDTLLRCPENQLVLTHLFRILADGGPDCNPRSNAKLNTDCSCIQSFPNPSLYLTRSVIWINADPLHHSNVMHLLIDTIQIIQLRTKTHVKANPSHQSRKRPPSFINRTRSRPSKSGF